jgi:hypothetical protein
MAIKTTVSSNFHSRYANIIHSDDQKRKGYILMSEFEATTSMRTDRTYDHVLRTKRQLQRRLHRDSEGHLVHPCITKLATYKEVAQTAVRTRTPGLLRPSNQAGGEAGEPSVLENSRRSTWFCQSGIRARRSSRTVSVKHKAGAREGDPYTAWGHRCYYTPPF